MKKSVVFLFVAILVSMLSGCILSKTPSTNEVNLAINDQMTFSVQGLLNGPYVWSKDDVVIPGVTGPTYTYTALNGDAPSFVLKVQTTDMLTKKILVTQWTVTVTNLSDPITSLLDSLVPIPAGTFMMGSTDNEYQQAQYTMPVHAVTLQPFDIGKYDVTQAQYLAVMGTNPSYFKAPSYPDTDNNPVEDVSWYDARAFCTALSALTGRTFTLPSEAQWEYVCRAGSTTLYSYGDSDALLGNYAWYSSNSGGRTHTVGTKLPNPWGLYDMHGNVWEWCLDSFHENYVGAPTDGSAWESETGSYRLVRGGGWNIAGPWYFRSAFRGSNYIPGGRYLNVGFRVLAVR